jgi:type IV pilus assembly protein PilY1
LDNKFKLFQIANPIKDATQRNGLGAPNVTYGNDGAVNYVYAGDLQGNMWRFDFTGTDLSKAKTVTTPVFTAKTPTGANAADYCAAADRFCSGGGYILLFGTGKYVETYDVTPANYLVNTYYAILDTTYTADAVTGRSQLVPRTVTLSGTGLTLTGDKFTYGTATGTKKGWYFDFYDSKNTGEHSSHIARYNCWKLLFFNTLIPSNDPCSAAVLAEIWSMY